MLLRVDVTFGTVLAVLAVLLVAAAGTRRSRISGGHVRSRRRESARRPNSARSPR
ncbi:hypothetical protein [Streptomyces sp. NPDC058595]|uniref:hypothetical protein n=1 Tax=Streptomyces sp. NPDC058595 TaxID=3346550 RepID=UPI00364F3E0C